ncbi:unnamed protein product [Prorocentrum cordatum]|uniref:Uncharacterized protein n=1 Tax=Prorocentrum cordatum TaxID=2364126 RepID=A0ABN9T6U4_9DINO|nr:unnamed protein product [Polarella glacialis]
MWPASFASSVPHGKQPTHLLQTTCQSPMVLQATALSWSSTRLAECHRTAGGSVQRFCKCEGDDAVQPPCPGSDGAGPVTDPVAEPACERQGSGCEIECMESDFLAECDGTSCCELFQQALVELGAGGDSSDPSAEVSCSEVQEIVANECSSCAACEAREEAGGARLLTDGPVSAGRGSSGAAAAAALAALGAAAVAVLGGAAVALGRWGAAQTPADAGEGQEDELLPEKASGSSSSAER